MPGTAALYAAFTWSSPSSGDASSSIGLQYGDTIGEKEARVLLVQRQLTKDSRIETPKTAKSKRRLPLPEDLALRIFKRKLERGAGDSDFIFAPRTGLNPPSPGNWRLGLSSDDVAELVGHTSAKV